MRSLTLALAIILAVLLTGCDVVNGRVEDGIKDRLPDLIGPAASYDVQVRGSTWQMSKGKISEILIHGKDVKAVADLRIDDLSLRMTNVVADRKTSTVKSVESIAFQAMVSQNSLNEYLEKRSERPKVRMIEGKLLVTARPKVLDLPANVAFDGYLRGSGRTLNIVVGQLEVQGVDTPKVAAKWLEDWINPVLVLKAEGFAPTITSVSIRPGQLLVVGTAELVGAVKPTQPIVGNRH